MFESNFPVDKASISYPVLWNAFKKIAKDYSATEKDQLFYQTAAKVYRITDWSLEFQPLLRESIPDHLKADG